jgi:hypothetical protein
VSSPRISYSLAVHNSAAYLEGNVLRLEARLRDFPGSEILLIENGSSDESPHISEQLARAVHPEGVTVRTESVARGYGNAHRRGLALARGDLVVMVGADLPFGFSDLDEWLALDTPPALVLGSKAHAGSRVQVARSRRLLSAGFRVARRCLLGIGAGDTQGSVLISGDLARQLAPRLACAGFLVTTEVVALARGLGVEAREVPVDYPGPLSPSTVRPMADSARMLLGLFAIRRRLRQDRAARISARAHPPAVRRP